MQKNGRGKTNLETYGIQLIRRMVKKNGLCTIVVTSPCVYRKYVSKRLFEMLKQEQQQTKHIQYNQKLKHGKQIKGVLFYLLKFIIVF